jgi:hypothetical protein
MSAALETYDVNPDKFRVPYAMTPDGDILQIKDGRPTCEELECPLCRGNVSFIRESDRAAAHFRHSSKSDCDALAQMHRDTLHNAVRDAAAQMLNGRTKARDICSHAGTRALPTGFCSVEKNANYGGEVWRPDLTVSPADNERAPILELEVVYSSKPTDKRLEAASAAGRLIGILNIEGLEQSYMQKLWRSEAFDIPEACKDFVRSKKFRVITNAEIITNVYGLKSRMYDVATVNPSNAQCPVPPPVAAVASPVHLRDASDAASIWEMSEKKYAREKIIKDQRAEEEKRDAERKEIAATNAERWEQERKRIAILAAKGRAQDIELSSIRSEVAARAAGSVCAECGRADWMVSITEPNGERLHVNCWALRSRQVTLR